MMTIIILALIISGTILGCKYIEFCKQNNMALFEYRTYKRTTEKLVHDVEEMKKKLEDKV